MGDSASPTEVSDPSSAPPGSGRRPKASGRTPLSAANRIVSSTSLAVPEGWPWILRLVGRIWNGADEVGIGVADAGRLDGDPETQAGSRRAWHHGSVSSASHRNRELADFLRRARSKVDPTRAGLRASDPSTCGNGFVSRPPSRRR